MGRYVHMDQEPVFGQSESDAPPQSSFLVVVLRRVLWNVVGPPAPVIRSKFKGGWGRWSLGAGLGRLVRR